MCEAISSPRPSGQHRREALSSIILAVISCEAFINELPELAKPWQESPKSPGWLKGLAAILGEAEESHASIESKYHLAKFVFTGQPFDKGATPFQDFALLIDIRNIMVHAKPLEASLEKNDQGEFFWSKPPLMRRLQAARIVGVDENLKQAANSNNADKLIADMVSQISSQDVALWACRAASAMVNSIIDSVPGDFDFRAVLELAYRKEFQIA